MVYLNKNQEYILRNNDFLKLAIVSVLLMSAVVLSAQVKINDTHYMINNRVYEYKKPSAFGFLKKVPSDFVDFYNESFKVSNWKAISLIAVSTGVLIYYDEDILNETRRLGRKWNINQDTNNVTGFPLLELPADFGSALYFIGDGAVSMSITASFLTYGLINDDNRALQTSSQLAEGLITSGLITVQVLKHLSGRTSPRSNNFEDLWEPFPNQIDYHKKVSRYDAYPSGHLTTTMATYIIIRSNYPEYKFIDPLAWTLMTALSFQMVNNGVHWAGDYPLAIGLGYMFGKIAVNNGRKLAEDDETAYYRKSSLSMYPLYRGNPGLTFDYRF